MPRVIPRYADALLALWYVSCPTLSMLPPFYLQRTLFTIQT